MNTINLIKRSLFLLTLFFMIVNQSFAAFDAEIIREAVELKANQTIDNSLKMNTEFPQFNHQEKIEIKLGCFGELVLHLGSTIRVDYALTKNDWATFHWDIDLGGLWCQWNSISLLLETLIDSTLQMKSDFIDMNFELDNMYAFLSYILTLLLTSTSLRAIVDLGNLLTGMKF